jgi:hypothetical protein
VCYLFYVAILLKIKKNAFKVKLVGICWIRSLWGSSISKYPFASIKDKQTADELLKLPEKRLTHDDKNAK